MYTVGSPITITITCMSMNPRRRTRARVCAHLRLPDQDKCIKLGPTIDTQTPSIRAPSPPPRVCLQTRKKIHTHNALPVASPPPPPSPCSPPRSAAPRPLPAHPHPHPHRAPHARPPQHTESRFAPQCQCPGDTAASANPGARYESAQFSQEAVRRV